MEYAERHGVDVEPGFLPKVVHWAVRPGAGGDRWDVTPLGDASEGGEGGLLFPRCPHLIQPELVRGKTRHFLVDSAAVVAFVGVAPDDPKAQQDSARFAELLHKGGAEAGLPELVEAALALRDPASVGGLQEALTRSGARKGHLVTVGSRRPLPVELADWRDWWRAFRGALVTTAQRPRRMRCFLTAEVTEPALTLLDVKGIGRDAGGGGEDTLIGFDKPAFSSYGLTKSENYAMSEAAAWTCLATLNHLVGSQARPLAGADVVYWFKDRVRPEDDPLAFLHPKGLGPEEERQQRQVEEAEALRHLQELLTAVETGQRPDLASNRYHAVFLSAAEHRAIVRDWVEGDFSRLLIHVSQWLNDLATINLTGRTEARRPGLQLVVECLLSPRKKGQKRRDWLRPVGALRASLWRAAACGAPLPDGVPARLLRLLRAFWQSGQFEEVTEADKHRNYAATMSLLYTRMGVLRVYCLRAERKGGRAMPDELLSCVTEDHPSLAYQCGRLMAVLATIQKEALEQVGASVVQRYYASASVTPSLVLGRLAKLSNYHLELLRQKRGKEGRAARLERTFHDIWCRVGRDLPPPLGLLEQSYFALGYYQQLVDIRAYGKHPASAEPEPKTAEESESDE